MTDATDRLAVALIKAVNSGSYEVRSGASDSDLLASFGHAARPIAQALQEAIREEVNSAIGQTPAGRA